MRLYGREFFLKKLRKNIQFITVLPILGNFCNFWGVFCPVLFVQNFPTKNWVVQKKNDFQKVWYNRRGGFASVEMRCRELSRLSKDGITTLLEMF